MMEEVTVKGLETGECIHNWDGDFSGMVSIHSVVILSLFPYIHETNHEVWRLQKTVQRLVPLVLL